MGVVSRKLLENQCNQVRDFVEKGFKISFFQSAPGIYTKVTSYIGWIENNIKANGGMASCSFRLESPPTLGDEYISFGFFIQWLNLLV